MDCRSCQNGVIYTRGQDPPPAAPVPYDPWQPNPWQPTIITDQPWFTNDQITFTAGTCATPQLNMLLEL